MKNMMGKPCALKQVNASVVRKAIKQKGSATRAEIAQATRISMTTVRTLLTEMLKNNEIIEAGYDQSIGGRRAVRYELNKNRFFGAAFCLGAETIQYLIVNICGEICEKGSFAAQSDAALAICSFLDSRIPELEIRSIGIGVPGIVDGLGFQRKDREGRMVSNPVGELIRERYGVPVLLENDLNAITLGFGRCYLREFPDEKCGDVHMAYLCFVNGCLSAGFLSGGRLLHGWNNFVGEVGLFPVDDSRTLEELLSSAGTDLEYARIVAKLIAGICCVLNPQYVAVGGDNFRADCLPLITECFYNNLPDKISAEIIYAKDYWHDYFEGIAYLTADQIFADVRLIEE